MDMETFLTAFVVTLCFFVALMVLAFVCGFYSK